MSNEQDEYVDPNSGAAPQPGGFAGAEGVALGHGSHRPGVVVEDGAEEEAPSEDEPGEGSDGDGTPGPDDDVDDVVTDDDLTDDVDESTGDDDDPGTEDDDANDSGPDPAMTEALAGNKDDALAYAKDHPDQKDAIIAAEKAGKNRTGVLRGLED